MKVLSNQIFKTSDEVTETLLSTEDQIIKFLTQNSKFGKNFKEIELFAETVSCRIYKVQGNEEEIALKIPKLVPDQQNMGFHDLIFETQLMQFMKGSA